MISLKRLAAFAGAASLALLLSFGWPSGTVAGANKAETATVVDATGNIRVPDGYRTRYQHLGSFAIAADHGEGSKEIHTVYASKCTIAAYRAGGGFPDGSVLVKEVFEAATEARTTGTVSHSRALKGWFVMVRNLKGSHPANPLWGDGWGWSWFEAGDPRRTTSTDHKQDCQACHLPARGTDWVYTDGYPPLTK